MIEVYDLRSALDQFRLIVEEGEGANLFTESDDRNNNCHFIRFVEIYTGCKVKLRVQHPDSNNPSIIFELTKSNY